MNNHNEPFQPASIEEQLDDLARVASQSPDSTPPDARMIKDLRHLYTDYTQSGERVWTRLAEHVTQQKEPSDKSQWHEHQQWQTEGANSMQMEQFATQPILPIKAKPRRRLPRLFTLVAALLVIALLVGSTFWMLTILSHTEVGGHQEAPVQKKMPRPVPDLYDLTSQGLYALDANTGKQLWHTSTASSAGNGLIVSGKAVYTNDGATVSAFDAQSGTLRWQFAYNSQPSDPSNPNSKLLVGQDSLYLIENSSIFASAGPQYGMNSTQAPPLTPMSSTLYALNPITGKLLWQHTLSYSLADPVIEGNVIYGIGSTTLHGSLYALKGSDGSVLWQQPLAQTSKLFYDFVAVDGTLYFASTSNIAQSQLLVYAYALSNGQERWQSQPMYNNNTYNITIAGNTLYYRVGDHTLYAFNTQNGSILWMHTIPTIFGTNAFPVANGLLYSFTQVNQNDPPYYVQAFNAASGQPVWSRQIALTGSVAPDLMVAHNRLYLYSSDNSSVPDKMTIFNALTGTPITSYALPKDTGFSQLLLLS